MKTELNLVSDLLKVEEDVRPGLKMRLIADNGRQLSPALCSTSFIILGKEVPIVYKHLTDVIVTIVITVGVNESGFEFAALPRFCMSFTSWQ